MAYTFEEECFAAGVKEDEVLRIAKGLSKYAEQARAMGLTVFGGTGGGSLRKRATGGPADSSMLVVAHLDGSYDGGDGAEETDENGLLRGE